MRGSLEAMNAESPGLGADAEAMLVGPAITAEELDGLVAGIEDGTFESERSLGTHDDAKSASLAPVRMDLDVSTHPTFTHGGASGYAENDSRCSVSVAWRLSEQQLPCHTTEVPSLPSRSRAKRRRGERGVAPCVARERRICVRERS